MKKKKKLNDTQVAAFCQQLYYVISSGLPAYQGISILMDDASDAETKSFLQDIFEPMQDGSPLHLALSKTDAFPDYMIQMISLGEETGKLDDVLSSLTTYYNREAAIKETLRYAIRYPLSIFALMFAVVLVLITKVLPIFSHIYESLGTELTGFSRMLMTVSVMINRYMLVLIIVVACLIALLFLLITNEKGRQLFQKHKLSMKIALFRVSNCLFLTIASGMDVSHGLELAAGLITNAYVKEQVLRCREMINTGKPLHEALYECGIFPRIYTSWINIGYTTGKVEQVIKKISDTYEKEASDLVMTFISYFEPALVIILSLIVGIILISFLLPLLGIMSSIG